MKAVRQIASLICIVTLLFVQGAQDGLPLYDMHVGNIGVTDATCSRALIIDWNGNEALGTKTADQRLRDAMKHFLKWFPGQHLWVDETVDTAYLATLSRESQSNVQTWRKFLAEVVRLTRKWRDRHQARRLLRLGSRLPHPLFGMGTNLSGTHHPVVVHDHDQRTPYNTPGNPRVKSAKQKNALWVGRLAPKTLPLIFPLIGMLTKLAANKHPERMLRLSPLWTRRPSLH